VTIRAVFRVQCDGPCKGWLLSYTAVPGTEPAAARFPGERAARTAALGAGWQRSPLDPARVKWLCPDCKSNPLGIVLPPDPVCICTHPLSQHNFQRLCIALPGIVGCGCLGFLRKEDE